MSMIIWFSQYSLTLSHLFYLLIFNTFGPYASIGNLWPWLFFRPGLLVAWVKVQTILSKENIIAYYYWLGK